MTEMNAHFGQDVAQGLLDFIAQGFYVCVEGETAVIYTPFLMPNNESVCIAVSRDGTGTLRVTDGGCVSDYLRMAGRDPDSERSIQDVAEAVARRLGVRIGPYEIATEADDAGAGAAAYVVAHAALSLASVEEGLPRQPRADFSTEIRDWLEERRPGNVDLRLNYSVPVHVGHGGGVREVRYEVDAAFLHDSSPPKFVQAVASGPAAYRAAFIYQTLQKHRFEYAGALLYNEASPSWSPRYRDVLEDTPAVLIVPAVERDAVVEWAASPVRQS